MALDPQIQAALAGGLSGGAVALLATIVTVFLTNRHQEKLQTIELRQRATLQVLAFEYEKLRSIEADLVRAIHLLDPNYSDAQGKEYVSTALKRLFHEAAYLHRYPRLYDICSQYLKCLANTSLPPTDEHRRAAQAIYNDFRSELGRLVESGEFLNPPGTTNVFNLRS